MGELAKIWGAALVGALVGGLLVVALRPAEPDTASLKAAIGRLESTIRNSAREQERGSPNSDSLDSPTTSSDLTTVTEKLDRLIDRLSTSPPTSGSQTAEAPGAISPAPAPVPMNQPEVARLWEAGKDASRDYLFGLSPRELHLELGTPTRASSSGWFYIQPDRGDGLAEVLRVMFANGMVIDVNRYLDRASKGQP